MKDREPAPRVDACEGMLPRRQLSGVSHTLRNSLNAIGLTIMNVERLLGKETGLARGASIVEQLKLAQCEVEIARRTIIRFVELVGPLRLERARVDVGALVAEAAAASGVTCAAQPENALVEGDRERLREALDAVLQNAVDASPQGPARATAMASVGPERTVVVSVEDGGPGFSPNALERAVEPFYTEKADRLGTGLSWAARVVEAHGGTLEVANAPGGGARVALRFPSRG